MLIALLLPSRSLSPSSLCILTTPVFPRPPSPADPFLDLCPCTLLRDRTWTHLGSTVLCRPCALASRPRAFFAHHRPRVLAAYPAVLPLAPLGLLALLSKAIRSKPTAGLCGTPSGVACFLRVICISLTLPFLIVRPPAFFSWIHQSWSDPFAPIGFSSGVLLFP